MTRPFDDVFASASGPGTTHTTAGTGTAGVYVHFPWCLAKCPYCDFVSYVDPSVDHAGYATAVVRELDARAPVFAGRRIQSVFFGGGTPSLWDTRELGRVLSALRAAFDVTDDLEVTVECNPTSLDESKARALRDAGVNRLSIGVQSLDTDQLRYLGRLHDGAGGIRAIDDALRAGMQRVSADLIFGLPSQAPGEAAREAGALCDRGLDHVSSYQLTIEPGTRFGELARRGRLPLADDGAVAEAFIAVEEALGARGLSHYEISNYARAGQEARHNLGYWRGDEYLGVGCAAYGFVRRPRVHDNRTHAEGVRWRNAVRPERYVEATRALSPRNPFAVAAVEESAEVLDAEALLRERIMLGLRVTDGIDIDAIGASLGIPGWTPQRRRSAVWLEGRGRVVREGARLRIPRAGAAWLWADDTCARLF